MDIREGSLDNIGHRVRDMVTAEPFASEEIRQGKAQFLDEVARRNALFARARVTRPRSRRWLALAFATSFAAGAAGLWMWMRPVSFQVGETRPGQLGDVIASAGTPTPLHFSEGSSVVLHEGGRMRVLSLETGAARVLVEDGTIDASIAHRKTGKTRWDFEAGPYHVRVTGTRFQMAFRPADQWFKLSTEEGQVVVSGGCQKGPTTVSAGETLELSCPGPSPGKEAERTEASAAANPPPSDPLAEEGSEEGAEEGSEGLSAPPLGSTGGSGRASHPDVWRELLAAGRLSEGLRAAERNNFERACHIATAKELLALADAGRLFGRPARAMAALRILRQRFPGSADASTAAFTLGRIAFERQHAYPQAAIWFETYLHEQPNGPLMGDSFGRLMEARSRAGDHARARSDAQQYLRRFPEGPYASEARGILSR